MHAKLKCSSSAVWSNIHKQPIPQGMKNKTLMHLVLLGTILIEQNKIHNTKRSIAWLALYYTIWEITLWVRNWSKYMYSIFFIYFFFIFFIKYSVSGTACNTSVHCSWKAARHQSMMKYFTFVWHLVAIHQPFWPVSAWLSSTLQSYSWLTCLTLCKNVQHWKLWSICLML